jgi:hypothetical protein
MWQWVKVVLGVAALSVGASAPTLIVEALRPGSIAALNPSAPGIRETGKKADTETSRSDDYPPQVHPSHNEGGSANHQNRSEQQPSSDWWLNGGLILVGLLQLYVFGMQAKRLRQSVDLTRDIASRQETDMRASIAEAARAATAMEGVATGIAGTLENARAMAATQREFWSNQMRAYLAVSLGGHIPQDRNTSWHSEVRMFVYNNGLTPAHGVSVASMLAWLPSPLPENMDFTIPRPELNQHIAPRQSFFFRAWLDRMLTDDELVMMKRGGDFQLYVYGTVNYRDISGEARRTNFCQLLAWDVKDNVSSFNVGPHNEAT